MRHPTIIGMVIVVMLGLPGCATWGKQEVQVVDTFCLTAKKRNWSIDRDQPDRIREARIWNEVIDRRCGIPGKA